MTMSSIIQEMVLKFLSDKQEHSVQEIKHYLKERDIHDYTEGQFAGSLNTLMRNVLIKYLNILSHLYAKKQDLNLYEWTS